MSASPEMHHQHQQLQQEANAPLEMKSNSAEGTPPPELATMTTVSVLDLHKDYNGGGGGGGGGSAESGATGGAVTSPHIVHEGATDMSLPDDGTTEKVYDKDTNTVYVYTTAAGVAGHNRDIINGEHHIITRNENGETILTRIAISTADQLLNRMDNGIIYTTTGGSTGVIGAGPQEQLPTTVLQYEKDVEDKHQPQQQQQQHHGHAHAAHQPQTIYAAAGAAPDQTGQTKQIVYALGGGEPKNVIYGDPKAAMPHFEAVPGAGSGAGSGGPGSVEEEKPQIDYVYNEGNKTVIYTDQKGLESLYANNELGLMDGTQIVVQSNLYTQQQGPDGTTVYVVSSDMNPEDINGLQQSSIDDVMAAAEIEQLTFDWETV
uniref:Uncharacterized protein n=1 Tax=Anopheles merus TaxID=30066 RepID=A0A182UZ10_ANOME